MLPSWIRSSSDMPRPTYFLATETTRRRLASVRSRRARLALVLDLRQRLVERRPDRARVEESALEAARASGQLAVATVLGAPAQQARRAGCGITIEASTRPRSVSSSGVSTSCGDRSHMLRIDVGERAERAQRLARRQRRAYRPGVGQREAIQHSQPSGSTRRYSAADVGPPLASACGAKQHPAGRCRASMARASRFSPSQVSSGTVPISRRYMRTWSSKPSPSVARRNQRRAARSPPRPRAPQARRGCGPAIQLR